jgi:hypothetical protein
MTALDLIHEANSFGVELSSDGTNLILSPGGKLPEELKELLREVKPELIAALRVRPETCEASCYEIEPGRWVHHPWNGCTTRPGKNDLTSQVVGVMAETACQHCSGAGKCGCVTCAFGLPVGQDGDCSICSRRGIRGMQ